MILFHKFFNANAGDNGGGAPADTANAAAANQVADPNAVQDPPANLPQPAFTIDELKSFGVNSKEDAIALFNKMKEDSIPAEEKQRQANIEKANFLRYAAERNLINDDFNKYESLQAKTDRDLVFEKFSAEEKADNPAITDEEIKEAFESEYKLSNENEKIKSKAEAKLKRDAADLRNPAQSAWTKAQESYNGELSAYGKQKEFKALVKETMAKNIPDKISFKAKDKDEEFDVEVDVTPELRKQLEKSFDSDKTFAKYIAFEGDPKDFSETLKGNMVNFVESRLAKEAIQKAVEIGVGRGIKKGSNVGANNPFALQNNSSAANQNISPSTLEQDNAKIARARKQYAKQR